MHNDHRPPSESRPKGNSSCFSPQLDRLMQVLVVRAPLVHAQTRDVLAVGLGLSTIAVDANDGSSSPLHDRLHADTAQQSRGYLIPGPAAVDAHRLSRRVDYRAIKLGIESGTIPTVHRSAPDDPRVPLLRAFGVDA